MTFITCRNVTLAYDNEIVVEEASFRVEEGDYLCIVGENGSGKSTLMKGILGLVPHRSGEIRYQGIQRNEIGYLPQQTVVQKDFPASVFEVALSGCLNKMGWNPFYTKKEKERAERNLKRLDILNLKNKSYRTLSGGQQQRVLLARALCATDKLILLDEPVTGLDPVVTNEFYELIKELNHEGVTVMMVSHDLFTALNYANRILHLDKTVRYFGPADAYVKSEVGKTFLGRGM